MDLSTYLSRPNAEIPVDIQCKLQSSGGITPLTFAEKDALLVGDSQHWDCGYVRLGDYYLVSMYTPLPDVTIDMVAWWFWWHPQCSERYKAWYPGEHKAIAFKKENADYFSGSTVPPFQPNTQYPVERVGSISLPLAIDFVTPSVFGFSPTLVNRAEIIVCGHVGAFRGLVQNTEMAHLFFKADQGLYLVSRFWLGKTVTNLLIRKLFVTQAQAKGMAEHACIEYRNFNQRIPQMYHRWLDEQKNS